MKFRNFESKIWIFLIINNISQQQCFDIENFNVNYRVILSHSKHGITSAK